ncbi:MAG: GNAT family N-acetyltransferase [Pseudomonadota bacterium]
MSETDTRRETTRRPLPVIEAGRVMLRPLRASDEGALTLFASDPRVSRMTTSIPHPYPPGAAAAYLERQARSTRDRVWAIDATPSGSEALIGVIVVKKAETEIGYWLGPPFWRRGFMAEAAGALVDHLFRVEGIGRVTASVFADNPASARVLEKIGFTEDGERLDFSVARGTQVMSRRFWRDRGE